MLIEHPSMKLVLDVSQRVLPKMLTNLTNNNNDHRTTPEEAIALEVLGRVDAIDRGLASMELALQGLVEESTKEEPELKQVIYHQENYLLRLTGIYDRTMRMTGVLIGMNSKNVDQMQGNRNVRRQLERLKRSEIIQRLDEFYELLEPYRGIRNKVAHSEEISSREYSIISAINSMDEMKEYRPIVRDLLIQTIQDLLNTFNLLKMQINNLITGLMEMLLMDEDCPINS